MSAVESNRRLFEGVLTVEMKDRQGEITIRDELLKVLPIWLARGGPITDTHSNRVVGQGINFGSTIVTDDSGNSYPAITIQGEIFKDYELDNEIWEAIKSGKYKGLSFGGATKSNRTPIMQKDGSLAYSLKDLEQYEVAVCEEPAVPLALITQHNEIAKAIAGDVKERGDGTMCIRCDKFKCYIEKDSLVKIEDDEDDDTQVTVLDEWKNETHPDKNGKTEGIRTTKNDPCWEGYEQFGMKEQGGRQVPNCVKKADEKKPLNKPFRTPGGPKKFAVYVRDPKTGNVVTVRFGDPNMEIKRDSDERRSSFRARHRCDEQKDITSAAYWSCKMWEKRSSVTDNTNKGDNSFSDTRGPNTPNKDEDAEALENNRGEPQENGATYHGTSKGRKITYRDPDPTESDPEKIMNNAERAGKQIQAFEKAGRTHTCDSDVAEINNVNVGDMPSGVPKVQAMDKDDDEMLEEADLEEVEKILPALGAAAAGAGRLAAGAARGAAGAARNAARGGGAKIDTALDAAGSAVDHGVEALRDTGVIDTSSCSLESSCSNNLTSKSLDKLNLMFKMRTESGEIKKKKKIRHERNTPPKQMTSEAGQAAAAAAAERSREATANPSRKPIFTAEDRKREAGVGSRFTARDEEGNKVTDSQFPKKIPGSMSRDTRQTGELPKPKGRATSRNVTGLGESVQEGRQRRGESRTQMGGMSESDLKRRQSGNWNKPKQEAPKVGGKKIKPRATVTHDKETGMTTIDNSTARRGSQGTSTIPTERYISNFVNQSVIKALDILNAVMKIKIGPVTSEARRGLIQDTKVPGSMGNQNKLQQESSYINTGKKIKPTGRDAKFTDEDKEALKYNKEYNTDEVVREYDDSKKKLENKATGEAPYTEPGRGGFAGREEGETCDKNESTSIHNVNQPKHVNEPYDDEEAEGVKKDHLERKIGMEVELEFTDDEQKAKETVEEHLQKDPKHYSRLKNVFDKLKNDRAMAANNSEDGVNGKMRLDNDPPAEALEVEKKVQTGDYGNCSTEVEGKNIDAEMNPGASLRKDTAIMDPGSGSGGIRSGASYDNAQQDTGQKDNPRKVEEEEYSGEEDRGSLNPKYSGEEDTVTGATRGNYNKATLILNNLLLNLKLKQ